MKRDFIKILHHPFFTLAIATGVFAAFTNSVSISCFFSGMFITVAARDVVESSMKEDENEPSI
jgi:hypothetical protein